MKQTCNSIMILLTLLLLTTGVANTQTSERLLIRFADTVSAADIAAVQATGALIHKTFRYVPGMAIEVSAKARRGLENNPRIVLIEPDSEVFALDAELDNSWGVKHIGAGLIHESGNKGAGVRVAVVDTGIDYNHPDLAANYAGGKGFVGGDDPMDDHYHGTHCAGIVGAVDDDIGVVGVAPEVDLYAVKVLNASGSGYWSTIILGIEWCIANEMDVTSNSYGGTGYSALVEEVFQKAWDAGIVSIAAAGNNGNCEGTGTNTIFPANFTSVISVAATDKDDSKACFSSTGKTVELAAPGVSVYSTVLNGGYTYKSGTSMATPHTAGLVALMMAAGSTNNATIREALGVTAIDLGDVGRDNLFGFGLIDAVGAVDPGPFNRAPVVTIAAPEDGMSIIVGDPITFVGSAADYEDGDLTATLAWTSSLDGNIGTGGNFTFVLSEGVHVVAASVTDSEGKVDEERVGIFVQSPPPPPPLPELVSIEWIAYNGHGGRSKKKHLRLFVKVVDAFEQALPDVLVTGELTATSGGTKTVSIVTDATGIASARWNFVPTNSCFELVVNDVVIDGYVWDGETPENIYCSGIECNNGGSRWFPYQRSTRQR